MNDEMSIDWDVVKEELESKANQVKNKLGLDLEIVGNWLWLDGYTKSLAQKLKNLGFNWSKAKKRWFYKPSSLPNIKKSNRNITMDQIRRYYGGQLFKENSN